MLHILLTFDYELFFANCDYSEKAVLYDTTLKIQETLINNGVPGTFFIDTPSVIRYEQLGMEEYPKMVKKQVKELLDAGLDVQLHIHPIWFNAEYGQNGWIFNQNYYSLSAFSNIKEIIKTSKNKLNEIANMNENYKCCAFRAGGFCLSPEQDILLSLKNEGIRIDSSVCPGVRLDAIGQSYNWVQAKKNGHWSFDDREGVLELSHKSNNMYEIPIGTYSKVPHKWVYTHFQPKLNYPPLKGKPSPVIPIKKKAIIKRCVERMYASITTPILLSTDSLHANALFNIIKQIANRIKDNSEDIYMCTIGHPKFSSDECMENLEMFLKLVKKNCRNVDFITMRDAYGKLFETKERLC